MVNIFYDDMHSIYGVHNKFLTSAKKIIASIWSCLLLRCLCYFIFVPIAICSYHLELLESKPQ